MNLVRTLPLGVLLLAFAPTSRAMQLELPRPELCGYSDKVVVGEVAHIETHWSVGEEGGLERHAFLQVGQTLKGDETSFLVVVLPGGRMRDFWNWVEDVPELELGVRYALFLEQQETGWYVVGGEQGAVRIATEQSWLGETVEHVTASLGGCRG